MLGEIMAGTKVEKIPFQWNVKQIALFYFYIAVVYVMFYHFPNNIQETHTGRLLIAFGFLGTWRYTWWMIHFIRAKIYEHLVYPKRKKAAMELWESGWKPSHIYFMLTTYDEVRETTEKCILSIIHECRSIGVPATICLGSGKLSDEEVVEEILERHAKDFPIQMHVVRQDTPGKRAAIGVALRALSRKGVIGDAPVVFMDGDSILEPGCLRLCLPHFELDRNMHALTTNEVAVIHGPWWTSSWFEMRFAQRHLAMQSHSLSRKVLTLTGRMSIIRASKVVEREFIEIIESDHLDHWLWGKFVFLSGDDKSTWYKLLKDGAEMMYVPDAVVTTIDNMSHKPVSHAVQNMIRWSGNMLRNGARAIALGPRKVKPFIWWCLIDQRIAMWSSMFAPLAMVTAGLLVDSIYLYSYAIWILITRLFFSSILFTYGRKIDMSYPFILYTNQIVSSLAKIYIVFRLPIQRWANRNDQKAYHKVSLSWRLKKAFALYLTILYVSVYFFFILLVIGFLKPPILKILFS